MATGWIDPTNDQIIGPGNVRTRATTGTAGGSERYGTAGGPTSYGTAGTANDGLAPLTGWAGQQGFTPAHLDSIYQNPWTLLPYVFQGINTSSPGYQALRDFGGDPLSLFTMTEGASRMTDLGAGDFANFMNKIYSNLGTSGGQAFNAQELLGNIFNQGAIGGDAKTSLGELLGSGDASTQVRTLFNLLRDAAGVSMNPLAASAYQSAIAQAGDRYNSDMLTRNSADAVSPVQWINQNMPWLSLQ